MIRLFPHLCTARINIFFALESLWLLSKTSLSRCYATVPDKRLEDFSILLPLRIFSCNETHSGYNVLELIFSLALLVCFQPHGIINDFRVLPLLLLDLRREIRKATLDWALELWFRDSNALEYLVIVFLAPAIQCLSLSLGHFLFRLINFNWPPTRRLVLIYHLNLWLLLFEIYQVFLYTVYTL